MSDTPVDLNLTAKVSARFPPFFTERIEEFREEYNNTIRAIDRLDDEQQETFLLDSSSEAHRRLLDLGMAYWVENGAPFGYAFAPGDLADAPEQELRCPNCEENDPWMFRAAVSDSDDGLSFGTVKCLSCGEVGVRTDYFTPTTQ